MDSLRDLLASLDSKEIEQRILLGIHKLDQLEL